MAEEAVAVEHDAKADAPLARVYEIGYMLVPSKKEDELEATVSTIRSSIEKAGGTFLAEGAPSLTRLAYAISVRERGKRVGHDRGYFGWIKFEAPVAAALSLERSLKGERDIMRSVLFQTVREETRARFRAQSLREVRRTDTLRPGPRKEEVSAPVSEEQLERAIEGITGE